MHCMSPLLWTLLVCSCCCFSRRQASSRPLLYDATDGFLDLIQPPYKPSLLQDFLTQVLRPGSGDRFVVPNIDGLQYALTFLGFTILVGFGLILVVLVPLVGICVCCCRCFCNKCSGQVHYTEIKMNNRILTYGYILMVFATVMLFGTLLAFVSNQLLYDNLRHQPSSSASSSSRSSSSRSISRGNMYKEFSDTMDNIASAVEQVPPRSRNATRSGMASILPALMLKLNRTLSHVNHKLLPSVTKMMRALDSGDAALDKLDSVKQLLINYTQGFSDYVKSLVALNSAMVDVKKDLEKPPFVCPTVDSKGDCAVLNASLGLMTLGQDVTKMGADELSKSYQDLSVHSSKNLRQRLAKTRSTLANMSSKVTDVANKYIDNNVGNLTKDNHLMQFWSKLDEPLSNASSKLRQVGQLKQTVTNPMNDTQVCRYLTGRDGPTGYPTLDRAALMAIHRLDVKISYPDLGINFNLSDVIIKTPVSTLMSGCTAGGASGSLSALFDTNLLFESLELTRIIDEYLNKSVLRDFNFDSLMPSQMYNASQMSDLHAAALNASSLDFHLYESALFQPRSYANLTTVLSAMANIAIKTNGTSLGDRLVRHHDRLSTAVKAAVAVQSRQLATLRQLPHATKDISNSTGDMVHSLSEANATIMHQYYNVFPVLLESSKANLSFELRALARHLLVWLPGQAIDCSLLGVNLRRAVAVPCVGLLQPFNGYWAGLGLCLLALLPCLLLALMLANFYRFKALKMQSRSYSRYSEIENISLDSRVSVPIDRI